MRQQVRREGDRFYDGGLDARGGAPEVPPDPGHAPQIELRRVTEHGEEEFAMLRRIAYRDRHLGELLVPRATGSFRTDLTSVPALFTWLVPKTGRHLPAALVHDGLVFTPGTEPTYTSTEGHVVLRAEADRVLRDAMADTGTAVVRRWLVWSAVATATMLSGAGTGWTTAQRWRYRVAAGLSVLVIAVLGVWATLDLLDVGWVPGLPWMGDRPWYAEVAGGLAGAVVVPLVLGLAWGRFRTAGWVVGVTLAVLLHVSVVLLALTGLYQLVEALVRRAPLVAWALAVVLVLAAAATFVAAVVG